MITDTEILVSRVIDGRATASDWDAISALAEANPSFWRELALAQRDHQLLSRHVIAAAARADRVDLPRDEVQNYSFAQATIGRRTRAVATWAGWATAAVLVLGVVGNRAIQSGIGNTSNIAGIDTPFANAADALSTYLSKGKQDGSVIGEQPKMRIVNIAPTADGQAYDVIYERSILEHARVENLYRVTSDEMGQPAAVAVQPVPIPQPQPKKLNRKPAV